MPRKKTIPPDDQPAEAQGTAESAGEENTGQMDLPAPVPEGGDTVDPKEPAVTAAGDTEPLRQPPDDEDAESDSPEYGTLLRELGQADHDHADAEEPLAPHRMMLCPRHHRARRIARNPIRPSAPAAVPAVCGTAAPLTPPLPPAANVS